MTAPLLLRRVRGRSMAPSLMPGQIIVASKVLRHLKLGDVVVLRHGGLEKIKRITNQNDNQYFVSGDNAAESTDSRTFGWVEKKDIIAKLVWPRLT